MQAHAGLLLAERLHLACQHLLLSGVEVIAPVFFCAISFAEIQLQCVTGLVLRNVIVGIDEIDRLIAKLYEDNFAGKLSDERYSRMAAKYEKEQAELLQSVSTKEKELAELERESVDIRLLLAGLREYSSMETLTPEVVNKIIKRIEVHNSEMLNGHKRVGIDIYFTGVGLVDLATIKEMLAIAESPRP